MTLEHLQAKLSNYITRLNFVKKNGIGRNSWTSHDIARRPSNMITQVSHTLAWFDKYRITEK